MTTKAKSQRTDKTEHRPQWVWHANWQVYGADKIWKQMNREGILVARGTVERLTGKLGLAGAHRGKRLRTTTPDTPAQVVFTFAAYNLTRLLNPMGPKTA